MQKEERDRLLSIQASAKRMYAGEDGEIQLKFLEHMAGVTDFVPKANLELVEGLKRWNVLFNKMLKSRPDDWIAWYEAKGRNIFST